MSLVAAELADDDDDPTRFQPAQVLIGRYSRLESLLHIDDTGEVVNVRDLAVADDGSIVAVAGRADGTTAQVDLARRRARRECRSRSLPAPAGSLRYRVRSCWQTSSPAWRGSASSSGGLSLVRLGDGAVLTSIEDAGILPSTRAAGAPSPRSARRFSCTTRRAAACSRRRAMRSTSTCDCGQCRRQHRARGRRRRDAPALDSRRRSARRE